MRYFLCLMVFFTLASMEQAALFAQCGIESLSPVKTGATKTAALQTLRTKGGITGISENTDGQTTTVLCKWNPHPCFKNFDCSITLIFDNNTLSGIMLDILFGSDYYSDCMKHYNLISAEAGKKYPLQSTFQLSDSETYQLSGEGVCYYRTEADKKAIKIPFWISHQSVNAMDHVPGTKPSYVLHLGIEIALYI